MASALCIVALAGLLTGIEACAEDEHGAPGVTTLTLPEDGSSARHVVDIDALGRFALEAEAEGGTRLQVVDHLTGPGDWQHNRADLFLEAGEVQVRVRSARATAEQAELHLTPFRERNDRPWPRLTGTDWVESELNDFEQRSYWLHVTARDWVALEFAGRYLADLRLWRDGEWLEDVTPAAGRVEPTTGQPLQLRHIHARLEPGLYRVTAYGGPGEPWAEEREGAAPLHIRKGIPELPAEGLYRLSTGPLGVDRWRIRGAADLFHLRLDEAAEARIEARPFRASSFPYHRSGRGASIAKDSRDPHATVRLADRDTLVTITRAEQEAYWLQHFHATQSLSWRQARANQWISTVGTAAPTDAAPSTALLVASRYGRLHRVLAADVVELFRMAALGARFNLLEPVDFYLKVRDAGTYRIDVDADGAAAEFRMVPVVADAHELRSEWRGPADAEWPLEAGYYHLQIRPAPGAAGILDMTLRDSLVARTEEGGPEPRPMRRGSAVLAGVDVPRNARVLGNRFDAGRSGLIRRDLPLTLAEPLPHAQDAGTLQRFEVAPPEGGTLVARAAGDGSYLPLREVGGAWGRELELGDRARRVEVRNDTDRPIRYQLTLRTPEPSEPPGYPTMAAAEVAEQMPDWPTIDAGERVHLAIDRDERTTYRLDVDDPALYRLETAGLLATQASLRSRIHMDIASGDRDGVGRNFLIQHFLDSGRYRLDIATHGHSAGKSGLQALAAPVIDGGELLPGRTARRTVSPGEAVRYRLAVAQAGTYRIHARGLERDFALAINGVEGWPVIRPGRRSPVTLELEAGTHEVTVFPHAVAARMVMTAEPLPQTRPERSGHGPHRIELNQPLRHLWREPEAVEAERTPDQWRFDLDHGHALRFTLSAQMEGALYRLEERAAESAGENSGARRVARIEGSDDETWRELPAGSYRLDVRTRRPDDRVDYDLAVHTRALPLGQTRSVDVPSTLALRLDRPTLVHLYSLADFDVRARLLTATGERIVAAEDRPHDWNFLISRPLAPGRYRLEIEGAEGQRGQAEIALDEPETRVGAPLAVGATRTVHGNELHTLALTWPDEHSDPQPLVVAGVSAATHGLSLERREGNDWRPVMTEIGRATRVGMVLPEIGDEMPQYRLRVWNLDASGEAIEIHTGMPTVATRVIDGTATIGRAAHAELPVSLLALAPAQPTLWALDGALADMSWATVGEPFRRPPGRHVPAAEGTVWLLGPPRDAQGRVTPRVATPDGDFRALVPAAAAWPLHAPWRPAMADSLRAWVASATGAAPAIQPPSDGTASAWASSERSALAVSLPGDRSDTLTLRALEAEAAPYTAALASYLLAVEERARLARGRHEITLPGRSAQAFPLQEGPVELSFSGPAGTAALLAGANEGGAPLLWTGLRQRTLHTRARGDTLWLINTAPDPAQLRVALAASERTAALSGEQPRQRFELPLSGRWIVPLTAAEGEGGAVGLGGAIERAYLVTRAAREPVDTVVPTRIEGPAELQIDQGQGAVSVWLDEIAARTDFWRTPERLRLDSRQLVSFRAAGGSLLRLESAAGEASLHWVAAGEGLDLILPAGRHRLARPRAGPDLRWSATPTTPIGEGVGAGVLLAQAESRAFTFEIDTARTVGIGLRTQRAAIEAALLTEDGRTVGEGVTQMVELEPGRYDLVVQLAPGAEPALIEPVVVGLEPPPEEPPRAVRERFRHLTRP